MDKAIEAVSNALEILGGDVAEARPKGRAESWELTRHFENLKVRVELNCRIGELEREAKKQREDIEALRRYASDLRANCAALSQEVDHLRKLLREKFVNAPIAGEA